MTIRIQLNSFVCLCCSVWMTFVCRLPQQAPILPAFPLPTWFTARRRRAARKTLKSWTSVAMAARSRGQRRENARRKVRDLSCGYWCVAVGVCGWAIDVTGLFMCGCWLWLLVFCYLCVAVGVCGYCCVGGWLLLCVCLWVCVYWCDSHEESDDFEEYEVASDEDGRGDDEAAETDEDEQVSKKPTKNKKPKSG